MVKRQMRAGDTTPEATKNRNYLWQTIYLLITFTLGGGISAGGLQMFSPTNAQLQLDVETVIEDVQLLKLDYYNYKKSQEREAKLKESNITLKLEHLTGDVSEIKILLTEVSNDLKEHNNK